LPVITAEPIVKLQFGKNVMYAGFDPERTIAKISDFISSRLTATGLDGFVIGLSGGVDSALSATLAVKAVGPSKVFAVLMPYRTSADSSLTDAMTLVDLLGIESREAAISKMVDAYFDRIDNTNRIRAGNMMARIRMAILFDVAHEKRRLVLGTGNRTEICLGYTTLYGDAACSVNPIGQLYKREVFLLAEFMGVPNAILKKAPSADLWSGQTDEGEIGLEYERIDALLERLVEEGERSTARLISDGFKKSEIERVVRLINLNSFKRRMPEIASLDRAQVPDKILLSE